jgi:hypothetical protein
MKKTTKDGEVLEGTPEELAEYEERTRPKAVETPKADWGKALDELTKQVPKPYVPWSVSTPTVPVFPVPGQDTWWRNFIWDDDCSMVRFFRDNPGAQSANIACFCKWCSPRCGTTSGYIGGAGLTTTSGG